MSNGGRVVECCEYGALASPPVGLRGPKTKKEHSVTRDSGIEPEAGLEPATLR